MTELQFIREKKLELIYERAVSSEHELIPGEWENTYCYADIDYGCDYRNNWVPQAHISRIRDALVYGGAERLASDAEWREKYIGAIRFWIKREPLCLNWWSNQIGAPGVLSEIAVIMGEYFPDDIAEGVERILLRGSYKTRRILGLEKTDLPEGKVYSTADRWTGANLLWGATTSINHALWLNDEKLLAMCKEIVESELSYTGEGIKEDGAFIQHGPRWYSAGYGRSFVNDISTIIYLLDGTSLAIGREQLRVLLLHITKGLRLMQRNGYFDFNAIGREYTRKGATKSTLAPAIALLLKCRDIEEKDDLCELYDSLTGNGDTAIGTRYYPSVRQLCHKDGGVYIGVRGRDDGIHGMEHCNGEGILSYNMSYGTITCFMESGEEYYDVAPFWDYSRIPGTTARAESDEELLLHGDWCKELRSPCRTDGLSDGSCGVLSEFCSHEGISLRAAYFTIGGALIALGANIVCEDGESAIATTVEQCRATGAKISKNRVVRGNVMYENLDTGTDFFAKLERKVGSWQRNSPSASPRELEADILTVTVPYRNEHPSYAYAVYSGKAPSITVLRNDAECQAVFVDGVTLAVFHSSTTITAPCGKALSAAAGEIVIDKA